jgi:hypothetical protein
MLVCQWKIHTDRPSIQMRVYPFCSLKYNLEHCKRAFIKHQTEKAANLTDVNPNSGLPPTTISKVMALVMEPGIAVKGNPEFLHRHVLPLCDPTSYLHL